MTEYEENRQISNKWLWAMLVLLCAAILAWGMFTYWLIPDRGPSDALQRQWDFGTLPDVPGESIYSTSMPAAAQAAPLQIIPLPKVTTAPASAPRGGR